MSSKYYPPSSGGVSNLLAPDDHRDGEKHDEDVDAGLRAERVDVACLVDPGDDAVEEAEGDDVLEMS